VRDGIERHTTGEQPATLEGRVVRLSDRIAYINHDIDDALRAGVLRQENIPFKEILGDSHSKRINTLITDTVSCSMESGELHMSPDIEHSFQGLHDFMFESVYTNPVAKSEEIKAKYIVKQLYDYFIEHSDLLHKEFIGILEKDGADVAVCDYIAGMTDRFAIQVYSDIFIPKAWNK
jgi:dGTPase